MPRKSLPPGIKMMKGYDVVLTETTEEDLRKYIHENIGTFKTCHSMINNKQNKFLDQLIDGNPYAGMSWRKLVKRLEWIDWMGTEQEKYFKLLKIIMDFKHDYTLCVKIFEWEEPDIQFMIEKYGTINDKENEFVNYERLRAKQSRTEWELKDAEWISENKLKQDHSNHKTRKEWEIEFKQIEEEMGLAFLNRWFPNGIPNTDETCKFCIAKLNLSKKAEVVLKEQELEQEQKNKEWRKQKEADQKEREKLNCTCCNFSTFSSEAYDLHLDSKEHQKRELLKKTYCKCCEIQCRTETDYDIHIQTKKHKYAIGELEKQTEFHCEKCNYKTTFKQHFEKHCGTKAHIEKV